MRSLHQKKSTPVSIEHHLNPFAGLHNDVARAMNSFQDLFEPRFVLEQFENFKLSPAIDIVEDKNCFKVEVEMPGMGEEDVKVSIDEHTLTIRGEKTTSKKDQDKNYISREISYGRYERSITLPPSADVEKASASFKKGMLWVEIPKKSESKKKSREIKVKKAGK